VAGTEMFSARSPVRTYLEKRANPDEPLGEFTQTWKSRSIKYYLPIDEMEKNGYLAHRIHDNLSSVKRWYNKYKDKRVFIIIEQKQKHFSRLNALWEQASGGEQLVKIFDDRVPGEPYHPEFWLLSNRDNDGKAKRVTKEELQKKLDKFVSNEPFEMEHELKISFDEGIELVGYNLSQ